jgi:hypothetical protein
MDHQNLPVHPWIVSLRTQLDGLEAALIRGDAPGVEAASAQVQAVLQKAPPTADFGQPASTLRVDMLQVAHRLGQLRQTALRAGAQNQRAINSLMPEHANTTYGRTPASPAFGVGKAYLSA